MEQDSKWIEVGGGGAYTVLSLGTWSPRGGSGGLLGHGWDFGRLV